MRHRFKLLILFVFLLLLCAARYTAYTQQMTPQQWQQLKNDKAFSYKDDREQTLKTRKYRPGPFQRFIQSFVGLFSSSLGTMLVWLIVIFVAGYIIYRLTFRSGAILFHREKKQIGIQDAATNSEDFFSTNWELLLQQATIQNDKRLAIRYSYMWLLQLLQRKQLINYRLDKTNHDYYHELMATPFNQSFGQLSRQYEYAWYGHFPVQATSFNEYMAVFNLVKKELER